MSRMIDIFDLMYPTEPEADTTHVVSLWYIPGGHDYSNARVINQCFSSEDLAREFQSHWDNIPEMAILLTLGQHLEAKRKNEEIASRRKETMGQDQYTAWAYRPSDEAWEKEMHLQRHEGY